MNLALVPPPATEPHGRAWLPPEAPLAMPEQRLDRAPEGRRTPASSPRGMGRRRAIVLGTSAALTLAAAWPVFATLQRGGLVVLELMALLMFLVLFAWVAVSFVSAVAGFILVMTRARQPLGVALNEAAPRLSAITALLVPTYNEDPARLMAGVQAICESLERTGQAGHFAVFVLSDTTRPEIARDEALEYRALRRRLRGAVPVYYRRREQNIGRKAGNIAEWVKRFGAAFPHMLILDADSLMEGRTVVRLASAMERHPDVALLQTLPTIVNGRTLFARMQQFASRVYGPVQAHGLAWWHGAEGNYWGHNAIIRTAAFAQAAGLPELKGRKPFAGAVLSHDFVEAALLRRGGWALHLLPGVGGSYEEGPPSLGDMLLRDRRWCQGNLQHGGVIGARGLHWISRLHLGSGIVQYLVSPIWAMLMLVGLAIPLEHATLDVQGAASAFSPVAYWKSLDPQRILWLFVASMGALFAPKILGYVALLLDPAERRGCGGALRALASILIESVLAALMAPIVMYVQSRGVAEVLAGRDSGWESQRRDDGSLPLSALLKSYGGLTLFGLFIGAVALVVSPALAAWMGPVTLGLVLAIPLVALTSTRTPGQWLRKQKLLSIPEETQVPPILQRASQLRAQRDLTS